MAGSSPKRLKQNGKVIIPAFSVGRTQQIVYVLNQLTLRGQIAARADFCGQPVECERHGDLPPAPGMFQRHINKFLHEKANPFGMSNLTYIREAEQSKTLNDLKEPAIIISASGMCEAGRIRHHLQNHIGDPKNLVLFIGYCAENTLGAQIMAGQNPVNIFGEPQAVRAKIVSLDTYSGHADKNELKQYVEKISGDLKKIICIHGEEAQCLAHAETLRAMKPKAEVLVPEYKQAVEI